MALAPLQSTKGIHKIGKGMKNMNQTQTRSLRKKVLSLILAVVMAVSLLPISAFASGDSKASTQTTAAVDGYDYSIVHVDCGRKYFSVNSLKSIIDSVSEAGMHYVQLAVGNDGLRFLLDNMELTVNGVTYTSKQVSDAIHEGNESYSDFTVDELTEADMDTIMAYAYTKGVEIIPLINTPGHMDAILHAATTLTGVNCAYSTSKRTIDVTNSTAVAFTKALLQKYITYFAGKGCTLFNMGADEYANDVNKTPHFADLIKSGDYSTYISYLNDVAAMIKTAKMTPMAFNDGIYYNVDQKQYGETYGKIDRDIIICYWTPGWNGYDVAKANTLSEMGFKLVNTHGGYYWIVGGSQVSAETAGSFDYKVFNNQQTISKTPAGAMFCIWSDEPQAQGDTTVATNVASVIKAFGSTLPTTPARTSHQNVTPGESGGDTTYTSEESITLTVGQTSDVYTQAGDVTDKVNKDGFNETVASIDSLEYTQVEGKTERIIGTKQSSFSTSGTKGVITDAAGHYMVIDNSGNITSTDDINAATVFTVKRSSNNSSRYTIQGNDYYLQISTSGITASSNSTNNDIRYKANTGFYISNSGSNYRIYYSSGSWGVTRYSTNTGWLYSYDEKHTPATNETQITFKGNAVGETSVIIGSVKYNITVVPEDVENVSPLELEYWITNASIDSVTGSTSEERTKVLPETNGTYGKYTVHFTNIAAKADGVASEAGVDVTRFAPANTSHDNRTVYYWRCRMLDTTLENNSTSKTERQTGDGGDDETMSGVGFTKIRYYGSSWQVFTENNEWVTVDAAKNQLIAYYLEYIKVSDEVESFAADWGNRGDGEEGGWLDKNSYCTLSMQVVYEDGSTNPTSTNASALKSKTIVYGYWADKNGRGIGTVLLNGQEYEIYKVTSETGAATATITGSENTPYTATVTDFKWDDNEMTVWEGDPSSSVSIHNDAIGFSKDGVNANLCWDENKEAILLRVYVRAKVTEDSLTVNYYDESDLSKPFYDYNIIVKQGTEFDKDFAYIDGKLVNNTVTNVNNLTQTVQWDLTKMKQIGAQYRYSDYEFTRAERSADGKTVNLYYKFNNTKTFVVDFGLPLEIYPKDMNTGVQSGVNNVAVEKTKLTYGTAEAKNTAAEQYKVVYTMTTPINGYETINITYTGYNETQGKDNTVTYNAYIIPATSVYYEDSFATFTNANGDKDKLVPESDTVSHGTWMTATDGTTQATDVHQALEALGGQGNNVYGYDQAYANSSKFSMGSATKVTVDASTADNGKQWPTASFTFRGTGFDVISLTDNTSGAIAVDIYKSSGERVEGYVVNNYYGYNYDKATNTWNVVNDGSDNALYQIPVMKVKDLPYGEYTAKISVVYDSLFDKTGQNKYSFWLDAIRIYDPMGTEDKIDEDYYAQDGEGYPQYIKLRDSLAKDKTATAAAVFIDGGVTADIQTYANYGPNNEVYLANGQAITFKIPQNDKIASIQIGAKAPNGKVQMTVTGTNDSQEISSATEMYYTVNVNAKTGDRQVTITNANEDGNAILSLTNLKITYTESSSVTLLKLTTADQENAVAQVRALFAEPVEPFNPDPFTASWGHSVRKGDTATLTVKASEDTAYVKVDGETVTNSVLRTERTGWGWWAKTVTYREFTYSTTADATVTSTIYAFNDAGVSSDAITATLTVRPSVRDWLHGIIGKWF